MPRVRYFAGARDAAGADAEDVAAATLGELLGGLAARDAGLADVLARCSVLVDGVRTAEPSTPLGGDVTVDVLPPFAGG
ncbi:MoaD/ThiS family protein [Cellulomonas sp. PhB143]|uniref:MoaD/ThiS family protein n=1 Tax=Cellulomonas sp. PhB143 TaxID=2485186 RepID=UPI000F4601C5|nr:MoaD/ThiS family protein [Cellulomonas sp. PhB143]ROS72119.1 molybdopterin converting factor small subunit [Cellulomonas sp. PhB143]